MGSKISEEEANTLAMLADLPLSYQNNKALTAELNKRMEEANQLSIKMRDAKYSHIEPITVFTYLENNRIDNHKS